MAGGQWRGWGGGENAERTYNHWSSERLIVSALLILTQIIIVTTSNFFFFSMAHNSAWVQTETEEFKLQSMK